MFIEGIFLQGNIKNQKWTYVSHGNSEKKLVDTTKITLLLVEHLANLDTPIILPLTLDRVSHKIVSLKESGSNFIGKAKMLNTPMGKTLNHLFLEEGVNWVFLLVALVLSK